jgi:hypothetical protein
MAEQLRQSRLVQLCLVPLALSFSPNLDAPQNFRIVERLGQKVDRAHFHRFHAVLNPTPAGHQITLKGEPSWSSVFHEIESRKCGHPEID